MWSEQLKRGVAASGFLVGLLITGMLLQLRPGGLDGMLVMLVIMWGSLASLVAWTLLRR